MSLDPRISPHFLNAGIGFGGSCLPKDVKALAMAARDLGYQPSLLESIIKVNDEQPSKLVELAERRVKDLACRKAAVLGLAFKPGTDDIREAPSLKIIAELLRQRASVKVYDPVAMEKVRRIFADKLDYAASAEEAVSEAEMVFIVTEWSEFKNPNLYRGKKVFDGRRILNYDEAERLDYEGICW
jgi:UDPglucose 6-dehydrogenase